MGQDIRKPFKVTFLCTGNSCRSQMAEGYAHVLGKGLIEPFSAGIMAAGVNRHAIAVMQEAGIDISRQWSKEVDWEFVRTMDIVVTLCANALESCPITPKEVKRYHWPIKDPVGARGTEEEILREFRRARDEIRDRMQRLLNDLQETDKQCLENV